MRVGSRNNAIYHCFFALFAAFAIFVYNVIPIKARASFLLVANLLFYGFWAWWAPLFLLAYASINYFITNNLHLVVGRRRTFFTFLLIGANVIIFFLLSLTSFPAIQFAIQNYYLTLQVLFPLGFSYCMFKTIGYIVDVSFGTIVPGGSFLHYLLYITFFPQITMGPISRADYFLPQCIMQKKLTYSTFIRSMTLILFGYVKKLIFADRISAIIASYYAELAYDNGLGWLIISVMFTLQLYLDFSGYSDISIGISGLLGYEIKPNFIAPFWAKTITDYWHRWHVSLSNWLSDYVFTPINFQLRKKGIWGAAIASVATLCISGFWHGLETNYALWGLIIGISIAVGTLTKKTRRKLTKKSPAILNTPLSIATTFCYIVFTNVLIRSSDFAASKYIYSRIFNPLYYSFSLGFAPKTIGIFLFALLVVIVSHIREAHETYCFEIIENRPLIVRWLVAYIIIFALLLFGVSDNTFGGFIYAQF